jgi:hypothetical protein
MSYPNLNNPGIGLPCYYHSEYSSYSEMILTLKQDSPLKSSKNKNKLIIQIKGKNTKL